MPNESASQQPLQIAYLKGDATKPQCAGIKIIAHVCNNRGGWGKGFVVAISNRWQEPEKNYRQWHKKGADDGFALGAIQLVQVDDTLYVANMIAQHGFTNQSNPVPLRYESLDECLQKLAAKARALNASVHMPRIGCGLAGGKWEKIEPMLEAHLIQNGINTVVYDFV